MPKAILTIIIVSVILFLLGLIVHYKEKETIPLNEALKSRELKRINEE
jgi:hypothetical protein